MQIEKPSNLYQIYSFSQIKSIRNTLADKKIPGIIVNQQENMVECKDNQSEVTIVRSQHPFQHDQCVSYFEVEVLMVAIDDGISIGLMTNDNNLKQHLGKSNNSFGYFKVQEKQKDLHAMPKFCKRPAITRSTISLNSDNPKKDQIVQEAKGRNGLFLFKSSDMIMSQRLVGQNFQSQPPQRKNTETAVNTQSKYNIVSNLSNTSNYDPSNEEQSLQSNMVQRQEENNQQLLDQNQNFLMNENLEIIHLIKEKKIQEALEIISKKIPALLEDTHIVAFMKAHIFLRIVQQESNMSAIAFSQRQRQILGIHKETLFPFYVEFQDRIVWKPLKHIYTALGFKVKGNNRQNRDVLSRKQFMYFSEYINSLIHKRMGYLGCSRLAFLFNYTKKLLEKLKGFKGMSCGLQLKI